jgi:hypothetical protein
MGRLVVSAAVQATAQGVGLVVSVSGADDGLPRSGLAPTNFAVVSLAPGEDLPPRERRIAQATEGPAGVYQLALEGTDPPAMPEPRHIILAIAVSGDTETGWADDQGQSIAAGTLR